MQRTAIMEAPAPVVADPVMLNDPQAGEVALWKTRCVKAGNPLLLIHSVNAAASAYEVRPLFEFFERNRPVYALELPGFGHSERSDRLYNFPVMVAAVRAAARWLKEQSGGKAVDVLALSLSCEFAAAAQLLSPGDVRTLGMISPTGFERRSPARIMRLPYAKSLLNWALVKPPWSPALFRGIMRRRVIRRFLERTWGSREIDENLLEYDWAVSRQEGAHFAPFAFVSGRLFASEPMKLYERLTLPVWVAHGTRGDFVDYRKLPDFIAVRAHCSASIFETGAFPHFENLPAFVSAYECAIGS